MSKKTNTTTNKKVNLATINKLTKVIINNFANAMFKRAELSAKKSADLKPLREKLAKATTPEEIETINTQIASIEHAFKVAIEPLEDDIKIACKLVPSELYNAYCEYVTKSTSTSFKKQIEFFLAECDIESGEVGYKWVTTMMLRKIGVKQASTNKQSKDKVLTVSYSKMQFNKIFLSCFYDLLVEKSVIRNK